MFNHDLKYGLDFFIAFYSLNIFLSMFEPYLGIPYILSLWNEYIFLCMCIYTKASNKDLNITVLPLHGNLYTCVQHKTCWAHLLCAYTFCRIGNVITQTIHLNCCVHMFPLCVVWKLLSNARHLFCWYSRLLTSPCISQG